ncbi:MAG: hypothetical protein GX640_12715 [Fibrobacter sp.]|nr:hypothetical protein [Fibrobacter sp.]
MNKLLIVFLVCININILHAASKPSGQNFRYIGQSYVDSCIQRGFYILIEASSVAGIGFRQKEAISEARNIVFHLKQIARGDPNERYILWKAGELEAQIYLEEKDLMLQQMQKGQMPMNLIISRYNMEVGKVRPDFGSLKRLHMQMELIDTKKANEMADSYNKRYRGISQEVVFSLEKALMQGDLKKARDELGYCLRNRTYLQISDSKYMQLENRVEGLTKANQEKPFIEADLNDAAASLKINRLNTSREKLASARNRFSTISKFLPQSEAMTITSSINKLSNQFAMKEDSLVNLNLSILRTGGVQDANTFLQTKVKTCGVSQEKIAYIDKAILGVAIPDNTHMAEEISSVIAGNENVTSDLSALDILRETARQKAQVKLDSLQAIENERLRKEQAERARLDSIYLATQFELQKYQDKATSISIELYTLLEQNKIAAAKDRFNRERSFLAKYMWKDAHLSTCILLKKIFLC